MRETKPKLVSSKKRFYVYVLMDPRKPGDYKYKTSTGHVASLDHMPFYVGKGTKDRFKAHVFEALNSDILSHKHNLIREILREGLKLKIKKSRIMYTNKRAYEIEASLINAIGRRNNKTGPLTNKSPGNGSEDTPEARKKQAKKIVQWWRSMSEEDLDAYRELQSHSQTVRWAQKTDAERKAIAAKTVAKKAAYPPKRRATFIQRKRESAKSWYENMDPKKRAEMKRKQDEAKRNYKPQTCVHCGLVGQGGNMKRFHFDNCKQA
jgi:hypothetical protein